MTIAAATAARIPSLRRHADEDPGEDRDDAADLQGRSGISKREPANSRSHEGLEVDERSRHIGSDSGLAEGEKPERQ